MKIMMNDATREALFDLITAEHAQLTAGTIAHHHLMDNFHNFFQSLTDENFDLQAYFAESPSFEQAFNGLEEPWRFAIASYIFLGQVSNGGFGQFLFNMAGFAPVIAAFVDQYGSPNLVEHYDAAYDQLYNEEFIEALQKTQEKIAKLDLTITENQERAQKIAKNHIGLIDSSDFDNWFQNAGGEAEFVAAMLRLIQDNIFIFFV